MFKQARKRYLNLKKLVIGNIELNLETKIYLLNDGFQVYIKALRELRKLSDSIEERKNEIEQEKKNKENQKHEKSINNIIKMAKKNGRINENNRN